MMSPEIKNINDRFYDRYMSLELELGNLLAAGQISQDDFIKRKEKLGAIKIQINNVEQAIRQLNQPTKSDLPVRFYLNVDSQKLCRLFYKNTYSSLKTLSRQGSIVKNIVFKTLSGHGFSFSQTLRLATLKKILFRIESKERQLKVEQTNWQKGTFFVIQKLAKIENTAGPLDLIKLKELFYQWEMTTENLSKLRKDAQIIEQGIRYKKQYLFQTERKIRTYNPFMTKWL